MLTDGAMHGGETVVLARSRTFAALMAIAFPAGFVVLLLAGLVRNGLGSFFQHGVLVATIVPGTLALLLWCDRYGLPAFGALKTRHPVVLNNGYLHVNGSKFPLTPQLSLVYDNRSKLLVRDGEFILARFPSYFIRIGRASKE